MHQPFAWNVELTHARSDHVPVPVIECSTHQSVATLVISCNAVEKPGHSQDLEPINKELLVHISAVHVSAAALLTQLWAE